MKLAEHKSQNFCSKSEIEAENELIRLRRKLYNKMIKTIKKLSTDVTNPL